MVGVRAAPSLATWRRGLERLRGFKRPLLLAWGLNLALALPAALPVYDALDQALSRSRFRAIAERGLDLDWFMDFRAAPAAVNPSLLVSAMLAILLAVFLAGGVLGRMRAVLLDAAPARVVSLADFLADCARYFSRFFRIFLLTAVGYVLVFWLLRVQLSERLELWMTAWPSHAAALVARVALTALVLWLFAWLHMAQDLTRLAVVWHGRPGTARDLMRSLGQSWRRFEELAGLYLWALLAWVVIGVLHLLLVEVAGRVPGGASWMAVLLVAQLTILARTWIGFGLSSSLLLWYQEREARHELPARKP
jgi:hypothetical protein